MRKVRRAREVERRSHAAEHIPGSVVHLGMVRVDWKGKMVFEATPPSGVAFTMDSHPEFGGEGKGPTPVEALLGAIAACSAMDVISILKKKQQAVESYHVEVDGERAPEGKYPRPFASLKVTHVVKGKNLDPMAVARAVELSDTKYCSVMATLREAPHIESAWRIEEPEKAIYRGGE